MTHYLSQALFPFIKNSTHLQHTYPFNTTHCLSRSLEYQIMYTFAIQKNTISSRLCIHFQIEKGETANYLLLTASCKSLIIPTKSLIQTCNHFFSIPVTISSRLKTYLSNSSTKRRGLLFNTFNTRKTETGKF